MSKEISVVKKTVKIKEGNLVNLIDKMVNEVIVAEKIQWINENTKKQAEKNAILENKIKSLEKKLNLLTERKK
jgi:hypothetical protein